MVDVTEFLVQKFSGTKSFLERGGDECDNLNFMNFKIDTLKIRKKSWILGNFEIGKIPIFNLCAQTRLGVFQLCPLTTNSSWLYTLGRVAMPLISPPMPVAQM